MSVGDSGGVRSFGGSGGGSSSGIAIGDPVTGGGAGRVLFQGANQNLAAASTLTYDPDPGNELLQITDGAGNYLYLSPGFWGIEGPDAGFNVYAANAVTGQIESVGGDARLVIQADAATGDPHSVYNVNGGGSCAFGIDNSDGDAVVLSFGSALGTTNIFRADGTTFEVVDVLKINNTVTAEVAAASTHKVAINIGGTNYYALLLAA